MNKKVKIRISEEAYYRLMDILKDGDMYTHIRFAYKDGCCGSPNAELLLDYVKPGDIEDLIDELPVVYDPDFPLNIKEITIIYREGSFMIKTELLNITNRNCSSCSSGCAGKGKNTGGCSGCSKKDGCN